MSPALVAFFILAVMLRVWSLFLSKRHEARLLSAGAEQYGAENSRLIAALHITFYGSAFLEGWWRGSQLDVLAWFGLTIYALAMLVLLDVILELGDLWSDVSRQVRDADRLNFGRRTYERQSPL